MYSKAIKKERKLLKSALVIVVAAIMAVTMMPVLSGAVYKDDQAYSAYAAASKVKITFKANGGKIGVKASQSKKVTKGKSVGALPNATRAGYTFKGWYTQKSGGVKIKTSTKIKKNMTVYARWAKLAPSYTVSFDPNGGTVNTKAVVVRHGSAVGALPTPSRSSYVFLGWYTEKSGGTVFSASTKITRGMTLYAQWAKQSPVITFEPNGGKFQYSSDSKKTVRYNEAYGTLPVPAYGGYDFLGWYTEKAGGVLIAQSAIVTVRDDVTLYAQWRQKKEVKIGEMSSFSSEGSWKTAATIFDNTNTLRSDCWVVSSSGHTSRYTITFLLNGEYSKMNGVLALAYDDRSTHYSYMVSIYCDGVLKYQNDPNFLTAGILPLPTELDVKGVQQIQFVVDDVTKGYGGDDIIINQTFSR